MTTTWWASSNANRHVVLAPLPVRGRRLRAFPSPHAILPFASYTRHPSSTLRPPRSSSLIPFRSPLSYLPSFHALFLPSPTTSVSLVSRVALTIPLLSSPCCSLPSISFSSHRLPPAHTALHTRSLSDSSTLSLTPIPESQPHGELSVSLRFLLRNFPVVPPPSHPSSSRRCHPLTSRPSRPPDADERGARRKKRGEKPSQVRSSTLLRAWRSMDFCSFRDSSDHPNDPNISAVAAAAATAARRGARYICFDFDRRRGREAESNPRGWERKGRKKERERERESPREIGPRTVWADFAFVWSRLDFRLRGAMDASPFFAALSNSRKLPSYSKKR